jgi:hypothetical protein
VSPLAEQQLPDRIETIDERSGRASAALVEVKLVGARDADPTATTIETYCDSEKEGIGGKGD